MVRVGTLVLVQICGGSKTSSVCSGLSLFSTFDLALRKALSTPQFPSAHCSSSPTPLSRKIETTCPDPRREGEESK